MQTVANFSLEYRDWADLRIDLVWVYHGEVPAAFRETVSRPDFMGAWLVLEGEAEIRQQGKSVIAGPNEWLILKKAHGRQRFAEGTRIISIRFQAEWLDRQPLFSEGLSLKIAAKDCPPLQAIASELLEFIDTTSLSAGIELRVQSVPFEDFICIRMLFQKWFLSLYRHLVAIGIQPTRSNIQDDVVMNVLHQLNETPLSDNVTVQGLAEQCGISVSQLNKKFRQEVGVTPKRYLLNLKMDTCRRLLAFSDVPIKEVAFDLGFARLSDFSAWFRGVEGVSPRVFRGQYRSGDSTVNRL